MDVTAIESLVHIGKQVAGEKRDVGSVEVFDEFVDVAAQALDLHVLRLGDVEREGVHHATVLGKDSRHLFA